MEEISSVKSASEVQFYSSKEHLLKHSQVHKAHKFLELNCILYDPDKKCFVCNPIDGYNKTPYYLKRSAINFMGFECDCQGFQTQKKNIGEEAASCSHCLALHYWFDKRNKERHWGKYRDDEG